jgi:predicted dehydrogenase
MTTPSTRRSFLKLGVGASVLPLSAYASLSSIPKRSVSGRVRHASVGVGGMGKSDLGQIASHPEVDIVALCDVDAASLAAAAEKHPNAKTYKDWRVMFEEMADGIDSVSVTTPDHMHAPVTLKALSLGKHVYCQKPLTRTVAEARAVLRAASNSGSVTQMGIQNHSNENYAAAHALFKAGHIGDVYEVHVWTDRPKGWWPQGVGRQPGSDPIPENVDWDLWLGVSPERPYKKGQYHPFSWRGWQDFGTGAQGDMACHLMDPAIWFLELGAPLRLRSDGPTPNGETYPLYSDVHYEFPANKHTTRGPLRLTWHDGGRKAPQQLLTDLGAGEVPPNACLIVGTKGALIANPYDRPRLIGNEAFKDVEIPTVPGTNHYHQYVDAVLGKGECSASFEYSAVLSEVALLGNVALAYPHETLEWDGINMRFPKRPEANALLSATTRSGWEFM